MKANQFQICKRCIMNSDVDPSISFNEKGVCNHCLRYDELVATRVYKGDKAQSALNSLVRSIQKAGKNKQYDCLIGVSGGVDSTYVAYLVKKLGLRPLAVHFDNGWNSELAVANIEKVLNNLDIDLVTYVVNWTEFKDLQLSFLKASVPDGEVPTDHAITALLWQTAAKYNIKYIISGMNFTTESISVPAWSYGHSDWKYIKNVHKHHGSKVLKTYPHYNFLYLFYITFIRAIKTVSILNYVDYNKAAVMKVLEDDLGWIYYGGKHFESNYTKFYQSYILPNKFSIDKRYGHVSDLINANQMTRNEALAEVKKKPYDDVGIIAEKEYVLKKLGLTENEFKKIMLTPKRSYKDYKNSYSFVQFLRRLVNILRRFHLYPR